MTCLEPNTNMSVPEAFDRNVAVERYCSSSGNDLESFLAYCRETSYTGNLRTLAMEIDEIQGAIWGIVIGALPKTEFSKLELEGITRDYVAHRAHWVDRIGTAALMQWVVRMASHEGYLQSDDEV